MTQRQELRLELRSLTDTFWRAQTELEHYLLVPDSKQAQQLRATIMAMRAQADRLATRKAAAADHGQQLSALARSLSQLQLETDRVIHLRATTEELYPAVPIMISHMLPAAISAFRNWIASRFGIFADPAVTLTAQVYNIDLYHERVLAGLERIDALEKQGLLEFQQSKSLPRMRATAQTWRRHLSDVIKIYTSDRWRTDVPLLRDTIHPLSNRIWSQLRAIDHAIEAHSVADLGALAGTAGKLSGSPWFITLLALAVVAMGYALFEYTVRRPIARVATALKAQARGEAATPLPSSHSYEIRDLIEAFAHMRAQVHSRRQRLETVLHHAAEGVVTFNQAGTIQSFNRAAEQLFGYNEAEVVGKEITLLLPPDKRAKREDYLAHFLRAEIQRLIGHEGEVTGRHKDGTHFPAALKVSAITLEGEPLYTGLLADISERKAMVAHLKQMAEHDGLTGLYNRGYFQAELERVVDRSRRGQQTAALLYIDLDNFKYVNDTLGHSAGDRLLIAVSTILQRRARKSDLIARLGGDEFIVLLYNVNAELATTVAEQGDTPGVCGIPA